MNEIAYRRYSFATYIRTGRLVTPTGLEHKFNPHHDPRNGRFTFADGGATTADATDAAAHRLAPQRPAQRKINLSPDEYRQQAKTLWSGLQGDPSVGLKNDVDVRAAVASGRQQDISATTGALPDVEAPADMRDAMLLVAKPTINAPLHGEQQFEKTLTFKRDANSRIVVDTIGLPGPQGGRPPGIDSATIAVAHVHYAGLVQQPFGRDESAVRALGIPSFVIAAETGVVWEVGRRNGRYVQRPIHAGGRAGKWERFGGR